MPTKDTSDRSISLDTNEQNIEQPTRQAPQEQPTAVPQQEQPTDLLTKPEILRKNIEVRAAVKKKFDMIAQSADSPNHVTVPALLRNALVRMLTLWWLHFHNHGTFTIKFPGQDTKVLVHEFLLPSISLKSLDLTPDELEIGTRVNLSLPEPLLDELEKIAKQQDKVLTGLMRDSFHLDLLLYKLRDEGGEAYITLNSGKKVDIVKEYEIRNPSPKHLLRVDSGN